MAVPTGEGQTNPVRFLGKDEDSRSGANVGREAEYTVLKTAKMYKTIDKNFMIPNRHWIEFI